MAVVRVDIRHKPGRLTAMARGMSGEYGVGEVFIRGAFNRWKAEELKSRGHDPIATSVEMRTEARRLIREGILTGQSEKIRTAILRAAQHIVQQLRLRITSGMLGTMSPVTEKIKRWEVDHGIIPARYGNPPPYGIRTGHMLHSMIAKRREGR